ncbi:hypothetical protein VTN00DRAFT_7262 [Thermoascus crustaceus]|uniref:uncharacterized protein n=1 Tax=Thermoascus crustaceus TaxID=5088 RepID=UPI003743C948
MAKECATGKRTATGSQDNEGSTSYAGSDKLIWGGWGGDSGRVEHSFARNTHSKPEENVLKYTSTWDATGCTMVHMGFLSSACTLPGPTGSFRQATWWPPKVVCAGDLEALKAVQPPMTRRVVDAGEEGQGEVRLVNLKIRT